MYKIANPLFLVCETPLHAGSGDSLGVVDLPIQRERHTSFPKIEGSSLKGAIRQAFEDLSVPVLVHGDKRYMLVMKNDSGKKLQESCLLLDEVWLDEKGQPRKNKDKTVKLTNYQKAISLIFGPEEAAGEGHAGALGFTDARLLLFPVKSMKGVFAWVTCPKVLQQFHRDMSLTEFKDREEIIHSLAVNALTTPLECTENVSGRCSLFLKNDSNKIVLEEYTFEIEHKENPELAYLLKFLAEQLFPVPRCEGEPDSYAFWRNKLMTDVVVLKNEDFTDFVNLSTEVITRTKISNLTGTVEQGMLFTEEYLPSESVLYSLVLASPIFKEKEDEKGIFSMIHGSSCFEGCTDEESKVMEFFRTAMPEVIQIGGNATLGKGLVRTRVFSANCGVLQNGGTEDAGE
ncbi:MAG: type III-B CRISPR module RAMP protein Cmr4 [Chlorobium sp.]|uniref:type III-B CRISPR module RAMP protein Cmr4 n=1 Tax=Chlorobium sp. TaxID=1095 RepID=UPI0025BD3831|nr:type III-B CRISPR module RAMP protein Cmr4 [Chlorobium sp.]MCF8382799.1 type III-B CRISPR module RAMP protein Cmr4 [Chlorobium sp.]